MNCIAAYQAKGLASYAASKVNLANPGTYDLTDDSIPTTWTMLKGFDYNGVFYHLTGITPTNNQGWSAIVRVEEYNAGDSIFGCGNSGRYFAINNNTGGHRYYFSGGGLDIVGGLGAGTYAIAGTKGYVNGVEEAGNIASNAGVLAEIYLGAVSGSTIYTYTGVVTGFAIYNTILTQAQVVAVGNKMSVFGGFTRSNITTAPSGEKSILLVPATYNAAIGAPLVIYHHGSWESETAVIDEELKTDCVKALLDAGYIVAGSNAYGENFGNDNGLAVYEELYTYCNAHYNISRVCAWGQSMGGISGLLSVAAGTIPYKGWLGTYPACDLLWMYNNAYNTQIDTAYGIDGTPYATATAGHDPSLLDPDLFNGIRMRFYASAGDATVSKAHNSDEMAALVTGHATECDVVVCTGNHGDPTHFVPADYVSFFNRCV